MEKVEARTKLRGALSKCSLQGQGPCAQEGDLQDHASHFVDEREGGTGGEKQALAEILLCVRAWATRGSPKGIRWSLLPGSNSRLGADPIYLAKFLPHQKQSVK